MTSALSQVMVTVSPPVKAFLAGNFQINPQQLLSVGYGKEDLKNPGDPKAAENRRVTIVNLVAR
jgi:flagellar motor protein MotB